MFSDSERIMILKVSHPQIKIMKILQNNKTYIYDNKFNLPYF